jgi:hypothetical protein
LPIINYWKHKITAASAILSFNMFFGFKSNKDAQMYSIYHLFKNDILNLSRNFEQDLLILLKKYLIMQTASFTGFIRILFLLSIIIFKFLAKLLLPLIVKKVKESRRELSAAARKGTRNFPGKRAIQR